MLPLFLPQGGGFQRVPSGVPVLFSPWIPPASPSGPSVSIRDRSVSVWPVKPWLLFFGELGAAPTPVPSPRSPSAMSSSRLQASAASCICRRPNPELPARSFHTSQRYRFAQISNVNLPRVYYLPAAEDPFHLFKPSTVSLWSRTS